MKSAHLTPPFLPPPDVLDLGSTPWFHQGPAQGGGPQAGDVSISCEIHTSLAKGGWPLAGDALAFYIVLHCKSQHISRNPPPRAS